MPDPATILFYDYYEANLFAHQMEEKGHRASVYYHGYGYAPWIAGGFRVVVFEDGLTGDSDDDSGEAPGFGKLPARPIGDALDDAVRVLTLAAAALCACTFVVILVINLRKVIQKHVTVDTDAILRFSATVPIITVLLFAGLLATILAYEGYRRDDPLWVGVMQTTGYVLVLFFALPAAIAVVIWISFTEKIHRD